MSRVRFSLLAQTKKKAAVLAVFFFVCFRENRTFEGGRGNDSFPVEENIKNREVLKSVSLSDFSLLALITKKIILATF